jgi:catechol 2,3-dioxygenase-like lactoylglutathione lyase family enzyme
VIVSRLAHVALAVEDLDGAVDFYTELLGLAVVEEAPGVAYLSCGATNTYELLLRQGEHRFDHLALAVLGEAALEELRERLGRAGLDFSELEIDGGPGLARGIETSLPTGHTLRLVAESDPSGFRVRAACAPVHHRGVGPVSLEHITLLCGDIGAAAAFGVDVLGLRISDSVQPPGAPWGNTHLRAGVLHHDLGLLPGDAPAMHHFAFAVPSVSEVVAAADAVAARGMAVDCSIGRHVAGNNVFVYFRDPAGHRLEVNTDMARVDAAAPPHIVETGIPFDAWRPGRPPALAGGSPARERILQRRP